MCLSRAFTDAEMEEWLADKPEVIEVWKMAKVVSCRGYMAPVLRIVYKGGPNFVKKKIIQTPNNFQYYTGFHFFSKPAKRYIGDKINRKYDTWIKCLVKKEWITAIGIEHWEGNQIVIIASQAIFPHYPEREARMEDMPMDYYSKTDPETDPVLVRV